MKIITPTAVERPYKLSEVSRHFGFTKSKLFSTLDRLSKEQKIFDHDIKQASDEDCLLSVYAVTVLVIGCGMTEDILLKLDRFLKDIPQRQPGEYLSRLYLAVQSLTVMTEINRIQQEIEQTNSKQAVLGHVLEFSSCPSDMIN